jgi:hypothetical protein
LSTVQFDNAIRTTAGFVKKDVLAFIVDASESWIVDNVRQRLVVFPFFIKVTSCRCFLACVFKCFMKKEIEVDEATNR